MGMVFMQRTSANVSCTQRVRNPCNGKAPGSSLNIFMTIWHPCGYARCFMKHGIPLLICKMLLNLSGKRHDWFITSSHIWNSTANSRHKSMDNAWGNIVRDFRTSQQAHPIRDLCNFLLEPPGIPAFVWHDTGHILTYLRDYLTVSRTEYLLARKWSHFAYFRQAAENTEREIAAVMCLIEKLEHAEKDATS